MNQLTKLTQVVYCNTDEAADVENELNTQFFASDCGQWRPSSVVAETVVVGDKESEAGKAWDHLSS